MTSLAHAVNAKSKAVQILMTYPPPSASEVSSLLKSLDLCRAVVAERVDHRGTRAFVAEAADRRAGDGETEGPLRSEADEVPGVDGELAVICWPTDQVAEIAAQRRA